MENYGLAGKFEEGGGGEGGRDTLEKRNVMKCHKNMNATDYFCPAFD